MSTANDWEPDPEIEMSKKFEFKPMPVGKHADIHAKQLKAQKRKKRLSAFGLENFDVEEIIINQQKKGKRDNRGSEDHSEDHQFVHEATADEPPEMSFVKKNTGFLASLSSTDKTVNLVCNGISTEHPSGKYLAACYSKGNTPLVVFDVYESDKGSTEHILFNLPTKGIDDGMNGDQDLSNTLDLGRKVKFSPCGTWLVLGGKGKTITFEPPAADSNSPQKEPVIWSSLLVYRVADLVDPERAKTAKPAFDLSKANAKGVIAMEFSRDGTLLTVSTEDKKVRCYYVEISAEPDVVSKIPSKWGLPAKPLLDGIDLGYTYFREYGIPIYPFTENLAKFDPAGFGAPTCLSFQRDGSELAIGVPSEIHEAASVFIIEMSGEREPVLQIKFKHPEITDVKYSDTGKWLAIAGRVDRTLLNQNPEAIETGGVSILNAQSYDPEAWIQKKVAAVTSVSWGVADKRIVIGDSAMRATLYATYTWAELAERKLNTESDSMINEVQINKFTDIFICGGVKTPIEAYRFSIWKSSKELNLKNVPENKDVEVNVHVSDPLAGRQFYTDVTWRGGITVDGEVLADSSVCALTYGNEILIHDAHSGKRQLCREVTPHPGNLGVIAWSDDGKYLAVGYREGVMIKKHAWKQKMTAYTKLKAEHDKKKTTKKTAEKPPVLGTGVGIASEDLMNGMKMVGKSTKNLAASVGLEEETSVEKGVELAPVENGDEDLGPEPAKPVDPDLTDDPETYYVLIYDATGITHDPSKFSQEPNTLKLIQTIPFNETITSLDWGKMSTLLSVTSADIDPSDNVQQGSCRVFKKVEEPGKKLRWKRESPDQFPFVATPLAKVKVISQQFLDELCNEYRIPKATTSVFNTRRKSVDDEKSRLAILCERLQKSEDAEAQQEKLYARFTAFIIKNTNAYLQEAMKLSKAIELTDPDSIALKLAKSIGKLYPVCDISKFDRIGNVLAVGLSREVLIFDTTSWTRIASVGREKEVDDKGKAIKLDSRDVEHHNSVSYLEWSPDGKILAVSRKSVSVRFYDASKPKYPLVHRLPKTKNASDLSWSLDDAYFVAICPDSSDDVHSTAISVFKTVDGLPHTRVQQWSTPDGSIGGEYGPHKTVAAEWSPDGSCLAEVGLTRMNALALKESMQETKKLERVMSGRGGDWGEDEDDEEGGGGGKKKTNKAQIDLASYFSVWYRGFNLNPQLVPLDLDPKDLVAVLREYPETLYVSRDYDTLVQSLIEQQRFKAFQAVIKEFPLSAGSLKFGVDSDGNKVVTNAFTVANKMRDETSLKSLLYTAQTPEVVGSSLPYIACESLPEIIAQGFEDMVVEYMQQLPFHPYKIPLKQANLREGSVYRSSPTHLNTSFKKGVGREHGGLFGDLYDPRGMQVTASHVALPNLGKLGVLEAFCRANSSIFDNEAMTAVLEVLWEEHIKKLFYIKASVFLIMVITWIMLVQLVVSSTGNIVMQTFDRVVYAVLLAINFWLIYEEYRQAKGSPGGVLKHFSDIWNALDVFSAVMMTTFVFLLEYDTSTDTYIFVGVAGTILLMLKSLSFLRGFESTGWLITVLTQNVADVRPFLIVMLVIILGSSVAFNLLLSHATDEEDNKPYEGAWTSFFTVFLMSVLGDFDTQVFEQAGMHPSEFSKLVCQLVFLFVVMFVTVVALNALIALLGDSYAKVSEFESANKKKERAELICEYMGVMRGKKRRKINRVSKFFHKLGQKETEGGKGAGGGESDLEAFTRIVDELRAEIKGLKDIILHGGSGDVVGGGD
ncbi:hypothetical protein TrVE_jg11539 [Triparma verrucosa]|uniref:Ion transport domain-containing protein n=1 Tax=Triparma verrucosa TaxID=1606542 RepID=A0A9W7BN19_9STRA|nr:hypothetical protein TrVE_jg11539 [Triparma verrucosa]